MPLVGWGALTYAVGLAVALSTRESVVIWSVTIAAGMAVAAAATRRPAVTSCLVLAIAGALVGSASAAGARNCRVRLSSMPSWTADLESPASPGGITRASIRARDCTVRATLLITSGRADAGTVATVRGYATADSRGLVVRDATLTDVRPARSFAWLRARTGARIDRLFGPDAPIVRALVIADMSAVPVEQRERFARAGLVHMLSVSGLHVAIIALALELLASAMRVPPTAARVTTLGLLALYVTGIGAPPPAVRAAVMLGLLVVTRVAQRPTSPWAVLAVGAVVPLVQPTTVLDLGWQLSVAGTAALVAGGMLATRLMPRGVRGYRRTLVRGAAVSVVATIVTAPLVAWSFGRIALLGPVTNLVADPIMAVLQPVLFLALCIPVAAVERIAADAAHALVSAFDMIATHAAAVPGGAPLVLPTLLAACAGGAAAVAVLVACSSERPVRASLVALCAGALLMWEPFVAPPPRVTELHLLDVGQGDAIALRTRAGRWIVVDAGRTWASGDAGRSVVVPYIAHRGGSVALFVLSHPHADHVGGAASVFAALRPARFLDPGYVGATPAYLAALDAARDRAVPWQRVRPGDSLQVDEVTLTALAPDSAWAAGLRDANLASTILLARIGAVRVLLTGDAEAAEEAWLLAQGSDAVAADVLKVAHHGSATSTTAAFLAAVRPRLALVSVGAHNSYGHPDPAVLRSIAATGAMIARTDLVGTVIVRTDGRSLDVEAQGVRWSVPERR